MDKETYGVEAVCNNCGHTQPEQLVKGTPINFARGIECPICGCVMAFRRKPVRFPNKFQEWKEKEIIL